MKYVTYMIDVDDFILMAKLYELRDDGCFIDEDGDLLTPYDKFTGIQTDPDATIIEL